MKYNVCQFTGHHCYGCCGVKLKSHKLVSRGIENNTNGYFDMKEDQEVNYDSDETFDGLKEQIDLHQKFKDRYDKKDLDSSGVCLNLILDETDQPFCPLHSSCNAGFDIRTGYCNTSFECTTFKLIQKFDENKANLFVFFINDMFRKKKLNLTSFSKAMRNNSILEPFELWLKDTANK